LETHLQEHQADNIANTLEDAADVPSTPSSQSSESSQFVPAILPDLSPCQRIIFWVLFCLVWLTLAGVRAGVVAATRHTFGNRISSLSGADAAFWCSSHLHSDF
jgi:hypothetical protein